MSSWLEPLASVANNLINKASDVAGWVVNHDTPQKEAIKTYIQGIQESDLDPLTKAALISGAKKAIKDYQNQNKIVENAIQYLKPTATPQLVNNDWMAQFLDKARLVADSDFQLIWGKILAEECNAPGSIPKALLHVLEQMDKQHAEAFSKVCSCSVCCETEGEVQYIPIISHCRYQEYFDAMGLSYDVLVDLKSVGLIDVDIPVIGDDSYIQTDLTSPKVWYFGSTYTLPDGKDTIDMGNVIFTRIGKALCKAVGQEKVDDFFEKCCVPFWQLRDSQERQGE